jgi:hypothetical protein
VGAGERAGAWLGLGLGPDRPWPHLAGPGSTRADPSGAWAGTEPSRARPRREDIPSSSSLVPIFFININITNASAITNPNIDFGIDIDIDINVIMPPPTPHHHHDRLLAHSLHIIVASGIAPPNAHGM